MRPATDRAAAACSDVQLADGIVVRVRHSRGHPPTDADVATIEAFAAQLRSCARGERRMALMREQTWDELERFLSDFTYVDASRFSLERHDDENYAVLYAFLHAPNSYLGEPGNRQDRYTRHEFVVPVATYNYENWRRWVYERLRATALHEVDEWFKDAGVRVFAPHHGDGEDPYVSWQLGTTEQTAKAPGDA